jgi:hypothetical protein
VDQFEAQRLWRPLAAALHLNDLTQAAFKFGVLRARQALREVRLEIAAERLVGLAIKVSPQTVQ